MMSESSWTWKEIAMRTHSQLKIFFAAALIALTALAIVTAPVHVMGAGQSKTAAVALPEEVSQSAKALRVVQPEASNAERAAVNRLQKTRIDPEATTPGAISFL